MRLDIDRLLQALDLPDLIRQAGGKLNGKHNCACPLHHGDNPTAFSLWTTRDGAQLWKCHTKDCGSGNALQFIQKWRSLDFVEAVKFAAELARIPLADLGLTEEAVREHHARELRRDVLDLAARHYQHQFRKSPLAIAYAAGRGFNARTLTRFGYSNGGTGLHSALHSRGANIALARECGLLRGDGLDFTANARGLEASPDGWLIYIHAHGGRVDYLSARAITPPERMPEPKDKSRNLPGPKQIYRAEIAGSDELVLVEGQADSESLRQVGVSNWALCGTSLSDDDARLLHRRKVVWLCLDQDEAGIARTAKLAQLLGPLVQEGFTFPAGLKDFNEWLQRGLSNHPFTGPAVQARLDDMKAWIDMRLVALSDDPLTLDEQAREIAHLIARLPDATRSKYFKKAAHRLGITIGDLKDLVSKNNNRTDYVLSEIKEGRLCFLGEPLANFSAHITHEWKIDDGQNPPLVRYRISARLAHGEPLDELDVLAEEFDAMLWTARWGASAVIYLQRGRLSIMARAIKEVSNHGSLKKERLYTYTGWTGKDEGRGYLSATGQLTATGLDPAISVDLSNNLRHYALPPVPEGLALKNAIRASVDFLALAPLTITAPLWSAMFAAPLTTLRSFNAVLWAYGPTQSGKSTIVHLALAHYGPGFIGQREFHSPDDWTSTITALEGSMFKIKDAPLVIDDFAPQFSGEGEARALKQRASLVVRMVGNRSGRGRARADLTERITRSPRGIVIGTAENPLVGQSIVGRMVYITVSKGDVVRADGNPALDAAQAHARAGLYAQVMSAYLQWLMKNWARLAETFPDMVDGAANHLRAELSITQGRLPDYTAILDSAQRLALRCFQELGALTGAETARFAAANSAAITSVVINQAEKIAAESPAQRFFKSLADLLDQNKIYLAPRTRLDEFSPPQRAELVGWFEREDIARVWLSTETCLMWAKRYWNDLNEHLDVPVDAMRRHIAQSGVLARTDAKQSEVSIWTQNKNRRALEVDTAKVRELFLVDLHPSGSGGLEPLPPPLNPEWINA